MLFERSITLENIVLKHLFVVYICFQAIFLLHDIENFGLFVYTIIV